MNAFRCILLVLLAFASPTLAGTLEPRTWTDANGVVTTGIYLNATDDTVTIQRIPDGQAFRLKISDCAPEEQAYVKNIAAEAREAESFDAVINGKITWRLPPWNNLSWSNHQPAELWIWDEKTQTPSEKLVTLSVEYTNNPKRNEFFGTYTSDQPVHLWKPAKYIIKGKFRGTVNGELKSLEQTSAPFNLPSTGDRNGVKLKLVRFSLKR